MKRAGWNKVMIAWSDGSSVTYGGMESDGSGVDNAEGVYTTTDNIANTLGYVIASAGMGTTMAIEVLAGAITTVRDEGDSRLNTEGRLLVEAARAFVKSMKE